MEELLRSCFLLIVFVLITAQGWAMDNNDRLKRMANRGQTRCAMQAVNNGRRLQDEGYPIRYAEGRFKGVRHAWVEYNKQGRWLVEDTAKNIRGWVIEQCRSGFSSKCWYEEVEYTYP